MSATGGPLDWVGNTDRIKRARTGSTRFSEAQKKNPWVFVGKDHPLEALAPPQQRRAVQRLTEVAGAEGSALINRDWKSLIDPAIGLEANVAKLLEEGGKLPMAERRAEHMKMAEDERSQNRQRARQDIIEWCEDLDDRGIDGASLMSVLFSGEPAPVVEEAREAGVDVDGLEGLLADIEDAFDSALVVDAIEHCRDQLRGPSTPTSPEEEAVLDKLRENFEFEGVFPALSIDEAIERIESQIEAAQQRAAAAEERAETAVEAGEARGRTAALNRLQRSFGRNFETLDDAVDQLQELMEAQRGPTITSSNITARMAAGEPTIRIEADDPELLQYQDNVRREVRRQLDLSELGTTRTELGTIRLENGQLAAIDLTLGAERLGRIEGEQPFEPAPIEREGDTAQAELPTAETPLEATIDDLISAADRDEPDAQFADFLEAHDADEFGAIARAIRDGDVGDARVDALADALAEVHPTVVEDALADQADPLGAAGEYNDLAGELGVEMVRPPEPTAGPPDGLEIEEVDEAALEAAEEIRRFATNLSDARLRQLVDALEADDPGAAPGEATAHLRRLDDQTREDLADELREVLQEREAEAERAGERTRMDRFPGIQEATSKGGGRTLAYWQGVLQELRGEREADRLPADELERVRREEAVLQRFIERVEGHIDRLSGGPSDPAEQVTGDLGISLEDLLGGSVSQAARRVVPDADRRDWLDREDWTAGRGLVKLEHNFMEWVYDIHGSSHRFKSSYFELKPENRGREIEMAQYARLQVRSGNSSVEKAVRAGLPAEWFDDGNEGGGAATV